MIRALILLAVAGGLALLAAPFVISSRYVDERGITIPGRVFSKSETVTLRYSTWKREAEATIEYWPADEPGVQFHTARLTPERYDSLHTGETVSLHYLRRQDTPTVPLANMWRAVHALPTVRLSGQRAFSGLRMLFTPPVIFVCKLIGGVVILLIVWRRAQWAGFWWALGICCSVGFAAVLIQDFPTPTPPPITNIRQGSGRIASIGRIDRLINGTRSRGFIADQPVDVVGIQFVPAGRTEPVVAVDLIDSGSLSGLKQDSVVAIQYEAESPRTAYIQAATRKFVSRNLRGMAVESAACLLVIFLFYMGAHYLGRAWNRLIQRTR
jgi:hypothetical protein